MAELIPWISPLLAAWAVTAGAIGVNRVEAWRTRREERVPMMPEASGPTPGEAFEGQAFELGRTAFAAEPVDVEAALHVVFQDVARDVARHCSRIRVAASADLLVRADRRALRQALTDMVRMALRLSPCAAILVTARRHGGRIEISCLADGPGESEAEMRSALRAAESIFALHGATMEIDPRLDGATMRVRLPELVERAPTPAAMPAATAEPNAVSAPASEPAKAEASAPVPAHQVAE
jgi:hypothetical protein